MDTVTAGNIAIAEFDGFKKSLLIPNAFLINDVTVTAVELKYHTSFDALMPVCKKCRAVLDEMKDDTLINGFGRLWGIYEACQQFEVTPVWFAVVEFINWYQTNKTSNTLTTLK
jgi:hypothetical protein